MREIKIAAVRNPLEQSRAAVTKADLVPPYVKRARNLCEARASSRKNPQAFDLGRFRAGFKQPLHAQADAQERHASCNALCNGRANACLFQLFEGLKISHS